MIYLSEHFGRTTAASQYFLQLAEYLGIPVISWNADNSGLERRVILGTNAWKQKLFILIVSDQTEGATGTKHGASGGSYAVSNA